MRMDQRQTLTAKTIVNEWSFNELLRVLSRYGEDRFPKQIARKIEQHRENGPINTTFELVDIIKEAIPAPARRKGGHPAKRTFQGIRIEVNSELSILDRAIGDGIEALNKDGVMAIITFHSLEDRIVKNKFRDLVDPCKCPKDLPMCVCGKKPIIKLINKKPIEATKEELANNSRSKSAKLRGCKKI